MLPLHRLFRRKARFVGEGFKPGDYGKVVTRNIRAERMTSSVSLPFMEDAYGASVYSADTMGVSRRKTRRSDKYQPAVSSHDTGRIPAVGREGLSGAAACVAIVTLICVLGVACLVDRSHVIEAAKRVSILESRIEEMNRTNAELETEVAMTASGLNVGYEAVQMGMISAKGVDVIYLSAPEAANMTIANVNNAMTGEYLATILGD